MKPRQAFDAEREEAAALPRPARICKRNRVRLFFEL